MPSFFTLRYRPTSETLRAGTFVFCFILVLGSTANLVPDRFLRPAGIAVAIFYGAIYFASLSFARRQQAFASLGITGGHWLIAVIAGMIANVFVNLYMLSVKPQQVIIASPKDLPIDGLAFILVIVGIFLTRQRIKSEQNNPGNPQSRSD